MDKDVEREREEREKRERGREREREIFDIAGSFLHSIFSTFSCL